MMTDTTITSELKRLIANLPSDLDLQADQEADRLIAELQLNHPMTLHAALCAVSDHRPGIGNFRLMRLIALSLTKKLGTPSPNGIRPRQ